MTAFPAGHLFPLSMRGKLVLLLTLRTGNLHTTPDATGENGHVQSVLNTHNNKLSSRLRFRPIFPEDFPKHLRRENMPVDAVTAHIHCRGVQRSW